MFSQARRSPGSAKFNSIQRSGTIEVDAGIIRDILKLINYINFRLQDSLHYINLNINGMACRNQ